MTHKKGDKNSCDNYRGIAAVATALKEFGKLLKRRIETKYSDMKAEEQGGFRAGRSQ